VWGLYFGGLGVGEFAVLVGGCCWVGVVVVALLCVLD